MNRADVGANGTRPAAPVTVFMPGITVPAPGQLA